MSSVSTINPPPIGTRMAVMLSGEVSKDADRVLVGTTGICPDNDDSPCFFLEFAPRDLAEGELVVIECLGVPSLEGLGGMYPIWKLVEED